MATDTEHQNQSGAEPDTKGDQPQSEGGGLPPTPPPSEDELIESAKDASPTAMTPGGSGRQGAPAAQGAIPSAVTPQNPHGTLSGQPLKDLGDGEDAESPYDEISGAGAVAKSATGRQLTEAEQQASLDWLLQADPDPGELETKVLDLNFGTDAQPLKVPWEIQPVGLDVMRSIREKAANTKRARRKGIDETRMNLSIIVAGTKTPDVTRAAQLAMQAGNGTGDPVDILRARFQSKPGYIAQISAEIMTLSGFDDEDVTEREMVEAAGNS